MWRKDRLSYSQSVENRGVEVPVPQESGHIIILKSIQKGWSEALGRNGRCLQASDRCFDH